MSILISSAAAAVMPSVESMYMDKYAACVGVPVKEKARVSALVAPLVIVSCFCYALRGNIGAAVATVAASVALIAFVQSPRLRPHPLMPNVLLSAFLLTFAVFLHMGRAVRFEYYLFVGYVLAVILLLDIGIVSDSLFIHGLELLGLIEAFGIYLQQLMPSLYFMLIRLVLSPRAVLSIRARMDSGYYTGFASEVSFSTFFVAVALGSFFFQRGLRRDVRQFVTAYLVVALILSGKKATLLAPLVVLLLISFDTSRDKLKLLKFTAALAAAGGVFFASFRWWSDIPSLGRLAQMVQFGMSGDLSGFTSGRVAIYLDAIQLWSRKPMVGIGWGNFKALVDQSSWYFGFDVHNCLLQVLCETGVVGFIPYVAICIVSLAQSMLSIRSYCAFGGRETAEGEIAMACSFIQLFFLTYGLTEPDLYHYSQMIVFVICYGLQTRQLSRAGKRTSRADGMHMTEHMPLITYHRCN